VSLSTRDFSTLLLRDMDVLPSFWDDCTQADFPFCVQSTKVSGPKLLMRKS
jgi:hypothetical protein